MQRITQPQTATVTPINQAQPVQSQSNIPTSHNNPGDLRNPATGAFQQYPTVLDGYNALIQDISFKQSPQAKKLGPNATLNDFANVYAPPTDGNNTTQYATNLAAQTGTTTDTPIGKIDPHILASAIAKNEGFQGQLPQQMNTAQLAASIKAKYPQYQTLDDASLVQKIVAKYPAYNSILSDTPNTAQEYTPPTNDPQHLNNPSLAGFGQNIIQSGANFAGNIINAVSHPLDTLQNLGETASGGLQELGGQKTANTDKWDNLVNYFKNRYGSIDNFAKTAYTDPVGVFGDASAVLGLGGAAAGVASKGAEAAGLGQAAIKAGGADFVAGANGIRSTAATGLAGGLESISKGMGEASASLNPLTPIVKGAGAAIGAGSGIGKSIASQFTEISPQGMQDIYDHPESYTPEAIANTTRLNVAQQVETALNDKITSLGETGAGYSPFKETPTPITVAPDFLDNAFRQAGVEVKDGIVSANSTSEVRAPADISKLQGVYNLYKSDFLNGSVDSQKFLNLRSDLADMAYNDSGIKSTRLASAGEDIRSALNNEYRDQIPGLSEKDATYSTQKTELAALRKGFIDKEGNLTQSAISKIANAGNKDLDIQRLEELVPGITRQITALKVMKEIEGAAGIKVGAYAKSITEAGGVVAGVASGNPALIAGSLAMAALTSPKFVVPLIKFLGENKELIPHVMSKLARLATIGAVSSQISSQTPTQEQQTPTDTSPSSQSASPSVNESSTSVSSPNATTVDMNMLGSLAKQKGFDLTAALADGKTPQDIMAALQ